MIAAIIIFGGCDTFIDGSKRSSTVCSMVESFRTVFSESVHSSATGAQFLRRLNPNRTGSDHFSRHVYFVWPGGVMLKALAFDSRGRQFKFLPFRCQVAATLGKLFTRMRLCHQAA